MTKLFGIDGCLGGWVVVSTELDSQAFPNAFLVEQLEELETHLCGHALMAIDMPIGLLDAAPALGWQRPCDLAAKKALGRRSSCLFYAPARGVLDHLTDYDSASSWHRQHTGQAISCQTYNILPKVKSLDAWLRKDAQLAQRVHEVHPELSFAHWNAESSAPQPLAEGKKTPQGREKRRSMIEAHWPGAVDATTKMLRAHSPSAPTRRWQQDDLLDAFAALWTAERIASGQAIPYPLAPGKDSYGLTLCIWA